MNKVVILGIDGVPYQLLTDLANRGIMPNVKHLWNEGTLARMESSLPEISATAWSSIMTGKNPGKHGIYGFTDIIQGTYSISYHSSKKLRVHPFWQRDKGKKYVIINLPATYPAQEINGLLISGFVAPDLDNAVYPRSYLKTLKDLEYTIDIDAQKVRKSNRLLFKKLFETLETRIKTYRYFWKHFEWDTFMVVFTGTDRLEHYLWDAYKNEEHEYHEQFLKYFQRIDTAIGEIHEKMDEEDTLILLSDHGMEGIKTSVNLNTYLVKEGFLVRGTDPNKGLNNIQEGTKAFVLDPARIYLNKEGVYPKGCVKENEEEQIISDLISSFNQLERNGEHVIKQIHRKEDIYHGAQLERGPDLVLTSNSGYKLKGGLLKEEIFEETPLLGKHTREDAFLLVKGKNTEDIIPENLTVKDVLSILEKVRK